LIEAKADLNKATHSGATPVWAAADKNKHSVLKLLLEAQADANLPLVESNLNKSKNGASPIWIAVKSRSDDALKLLLEYKANSETPTDEGVTPLDLAIAIKNTNAIQLLDPGA